MKDGVLLFNKSIHDTLVKNKKYLLKYPSYLTAFSKVLRSIKRQSKLRSFLRESEGLIVPPILIISVTNSCNLKCAGCYACNQKRNINKELSIGEISRIVDEAITLGVSIILIAGGEPLLKKGILDIPKAHPETLFVMFTNGLLMDENTMGTIKQMKNLIPVLSIEGGRDETDTRRGKGMYDNIIKLMGEFKAKGIMFGSSITLTSKNFESVMAGSYLTDLENAGCAVSFLIEYVPQGEDGDMVLTSAQKDSLAAKSKEISQKRNMLAVALPGDEELYGGCLAAGRGFLHISSEGSLEACPFAPYSDTNVKNRPLKQALKSKLIAEIRSNHHELSDARGGCALNENREWVESLM